MTEFEATFPDTPHKPIIQKLKELGGTQTKPNTLFTIKAFFLPDQDPTKLEFARVRDEGDVVTMAVKWQEGDESKVEAQKEIEIEVPDFQTGVDLLERLGCTEKAYQERRREVWELDGVHIMLDEWPYLEPFIEIEGESEEDVKDVVEKLGLDYSEAIFTGVAVQYAKKYGLTREQVNNETPRITFDENPFEGR